MYLSTTTSSALEGPYLIASVEGAGKYTLCTENGDKVKDGAQVGEKDLTIIKT